MSQRTTKPTIILVRPAMTQISLRIRAVWSESSLIAYAFYSVWPIQRRINHRRTGWIYMLIWIFAGHTDVIVGFVVRCSYCTWSCIRIKGVVSREWNCFKPPPPPPPPSPLTAVYPTVHSKTVTVLQFFLVCASVVSYVAFVLSLCVPRFSFFWCLRRAVLRDCGISWVS